jgi:hypothetical protein
METFLNSKPEQKVNSLPLLKLDTAAFSAPNAPH